MKVDLIEMLEATDRKIFVCVRTWENIFVTGYAKDILKKYKDIIKNKIVIGVSVDDDTLVYQIAK